MTPDKKLISEYSATRNNTWKNIICHAPFVNLNFEQNGNVRACCYNTQHILGQWPAQGIKQIWQGDSANQLRTYIRQNNLGGGCTECSKMLQAGNFQGVRAKYYDEFAPDTFGTRYNYLKQSVTGNVAYPRVMEFELSNTCNLECVMCNGYFSSSIRKNREHLPPIASPYDKKFVDELDEFIPHLTDAKFLGGEPFMIDIYLDIWERILKLNPGIRIHITTNGTFLNNRIKDLLEGLKAGIILSIDSVNKETYPKIRVNGNYDKVMENLEYFRDYTRRKKTFLSMAACPITYNWKELPQMLAFCIEKEITLYFNAVFSPANLSLRDQSPKFLEEVIAYLSSNPAPSVSGNPRSPANLSIQAYNDFINLLRGWLAEAKVRETESHAYNHQNPGAEIEAFLNKGETLEWSIDEVRQTIAKLSEVAAFGYDDKDKALRLQIAKLFVSTPVGKIPALLQCYPEIYDAQNNTNAVSATAEKIKLISAGIEQHPKRREVLAQISQSSAPVFTKILLERNLNDLQQDIQSLFS
jgi:MoaA/NifB/PqqE/SkfB family radical SAM enzyme